MTDNENLENNENSKDLENQAAETEEKQIENNKTNEKNETDETAAEKKDEAQENNDTEEKDGRHLKKEVKKLHAELKQKKEDYDVLYDKYLRVNAEYDNFRKRTSKEKESIYTDATLDVLKNVLPVIDNVERALQFTENAENTDTQKVLDGLKMIYSQFMSSLAKMGVEEIKALDEPFNPEFHNAVSHEQDETKPENTVADVLQKGYIKGDKVVRPAMVKVVN